jgi:predicted TIM-barrel fold metal-dependent hydrolase
MQSPEAARGVDAHAHVFSRDAPAVAGARYRPAYEASLEAWTALWPAAGVTHGVLVQPSFFGFDNTELLRALASRPDRLRGVAVVDPKISDAGLDRLRESGVRAIRLNLAGVGGYSSYGGDGYSSLFERVHARSMHVEVFVGVGRIPDIAPLLAPSGVRVVFDHFGNPGRSDAEIDASFAAVAALAIRCRVGVKLSSVYRMSHADPRHLALRWLEIVGHDNLVWGSDWPWTRHEEGRDYRQLRADLDRWLPQGLAPRVLWDNAAALYGFD